MASKVISNVFTVPPGSKVVPERFDVRVINKNLTLGRVTREEVKKHLEALPDDEARCERVNYLDLVEGDSSNGSSDFDSGAPINGGSFGH